MEQNSSSYINRFKKVLRLTNRKIGFFLLIPAFTYVLTFVIRFFEIIDNSDNAYKLVLYKGAKGNLALVILVGILTFAGVYLIKNSKNSNVTNENN